MRLVETCQVYKRCEFLWVHERFAGEYLNLRRCHVSHTNQSQDNAANPAFVRAVDRGVGISVRTVNVWVQGAGSVFDMVGVSLAGLLDALGSTLKSYPCCWENLAGDVPLAGNHPLSGV